MALCPPSSSHRPGSIADRYGPHTPGTNRSRSDTAMWHELRAERRAGSSNSEQKEAYTAFTHLVPQMRAKRSCSLQSTLAGRRAPSCTQRGAHVKQETSSSNATDHSNAAAVRVNDANSHGGAGLQNRNSKSAAEETWILLTARPSCLAAASVRPLPIGSPAWQAKRERMQRSLRLKLAHRCCKRAARSARTHRAQTHSDHETRRT